MRFATSFCVASLASAAWCENIAYVNSDFAKDTATPMLHRTSGPWVQRSTVNSHNELDQPAVGADEHTSAALAQPAVGADERNSAALAQPAVGADERSSAALAQPAVGADERSSAASAQPAVGADERTRPNQLNATSLRRQSGTPIEPETHTPSTLVRNPRPAGFAGLLTGPRERSMSPRDQFTPTQTVGASRVATTFDRHDVPTSSTPSRPSQCRRGHCVRQRDRSQDADATRRARRIRSATAGGDAP